MTNDFMVHQAALTAQRRAASRIPEIALAAAIIILALAGYLLFSQAKGYTYQSGAHFLDMVRMRLWSLAWLALSVTAIWFLRRHRIAPLVAVFAVSAYFLIQYGYAFRGTEYGWNGHWGDNGNRLAEICKMMAHGSFFQDWYLKDLPSFYPPGWFALMAIFAKLMRLEAYQTVKWGYYLIFLVYPWLLYFSWRKLVSPAVAASVAVVVLFAGFRYMNYVYYESMAAALIVPWWLYYVERGLLRITDPGPLRRSEYLVGALIGGAIFMTYYYWFFLILAATPSLLADSYFRSRSLGIVWQDVRHKLIIAVGVALVSAIYWAPLVASLVSNGAESTQLSFFGAHYMNLTLPWQVVSIEYLVIPLGIFAAFYGSREGTAKLLYLFLGGFLLILVDRIVNTGGQSIQSRKILEFFHVFSVIPLGIVIVDWWRQLERQPRIRLGLTGLGLVAVLITSNAHTQSFTGDLYRAAVDSRRPTTELEAFLAVEPSNSVLLTQSYIEAAYVPYYMFIPISSSSAHTAGQYSQRARFLDKLTTVADPELFAYLLAHNRFDRIDYVFLPRDATSSRWQLTLQQGSFNAPTTQLVCSFLCDADASPGLFPKRHERGMYAVTVQPRSRTMDDQVKANYPALYADLRPLPADN